jgi:hypothetical protein
VAETLASGDLTTAYAQWLASMDAAPDKPVEARDRLVTHYTSSTKDFTYLLSRFLARISA